MKPFGCPVTILNPGDHLGTFDGKADEGFFVGYSIVSKAMRLFNKRNNIVEETLNLRFLENTPNVTGNGPAWLFDVDSLIISINYVPVVAGNQTNGIARTRDNIVTGQAEKKTEPEQEYILIHICTPDPLISQGPKQSEEYDEAEMKKHMEVVQDEEEIAIDAIPLATKPPIIVEYKIVKEGQKGFYHLIRADGSLNRYSLMIRML
ncbi:hypothetical protein Tco_1211605 [Tanacetum coccineum]